jgi:hypothetical protein
LRGWKERKTEQTEITERTEKSGLSSFFRLFCYFRLFRTFSSVFALFQKLMKENEMRRRFILPLFFCIVATVSAVAQTTNPDKLVALQTEVRQLRLELIQQRIEFQQWKIEQIEAALKEAKDERAKLEIEERAVQQALSETSANEGDETASFRAELTENTLKKLQSQQASGQQRESELQQKLAQEQGVWQALVKRAKQVQRTNE